MKIHAQYGRDSEVKDAQIIKLIFYISDRILTPMRSFYFILKENKKWKHA